MQLVNLLWKPKSLTLFGKKINDWDFLVACPLCHRRYYRSSPIWMKETELRVSSKSSRTVKTYLCHACHSDTLNHVREPVMNELPWQLISRDNVIPTRIYYGWNTRYMHKFNCHCKSEEEK